MGDGSMFAYKSGTTTCDRSTTTLKTTVAWHCVPQWLVLILGGSNVASHEGGCDGEGRRGNPMHVQP